MLPRAWTQGKIPGAPLRRGERRNSSRSSGYPKGVYAQFRRVEPIEKAAQVNLSDLEAGRGFNKDQSGASGPRAVPTVPAQLFGGSVS